MTTGKKRMRTEWQAGIASMPAYVTGEGEPYRPEVLLWMSADGLVLGHALGRPGQRIGRQACASLRRTIEHPVAGRPHAPDRIRVASAELADALRADSSGIEIVHAPTPELDAALASLLGAMTGGAEPEPTYLSPDIAPAAVASLFRAAAALFRAKPWRIVPDDRSLVSVTIGGLGVDDAALSGIGRMGQSLGFVLFAGIADFEAFLEAADTVDLSEAPTLPPHFALNFDRKADLDAALLAEIAEHRWEVAGPRAYPTLLAVEPDLLVRPLTARDVAIAEAVALALVALLDERKTLLAAWRGGEPVARTLRVATHAGEVEVSLRVPYGSTTAPTWAASATPAPPSPE